MARREEAELDRDLADLPARSALAGMDAPDRGGAVCQRLAGRARGSGAGGGAGVSVDLLIDDLAVDLEGRPYEVAQVGAGWMLRTKPAYAPAIRAAADVGGQALNLSEFDLAVLAAIAFHQPISRDGLKDIFGKEISRDLIGRLAERDLIGTGPREPRRGAPYTFVTTETFLATFGMASLRDLPDPEQLVDAGLAGPSEAYDI